MTPERDFHYTLIKYLDIKGKQELSNIIKRSRIVYDKLWPFSGVVSYQRKMNINIKTPIEFKALLEKEIDLLRTLSFEIYEDDEYMATAVVITVLAAKVTTIEIEEIEKERVEGSVYQAFITEISSLGFDDEIEKSYLYEA
jgi:hypothetical protein